MQGLIQASSSFVSQKYETSHIPLNQEIGIHNCLPFPSRWVLFQSTSHFVSFQEAKLECPTIYSHFLLQLQSILRLPPGQLAQQVSSVGGKWHKLKQLAACHDKPLAFAWNVLGSNRAFLQ
uniref:Uncharacterized protein n=1 Tax=Opuntia streptacantha TaxID=393608 RepID=A0A7C9FB15_OPUST